MTVAEPKPASGQGAGVLDEDNSFVSATTSDAEAGASGDWRPESKSYGPPYLDTSTVDVENLLGVVEDFSEGLRLLIESSRRFSDGGNNEEAAMVAFLARIIVPHDGYREQGNGRRTIDLMNAIHQWDLN